MFGLFGLFKKPIHEPVEKQRAEVQAIDNPEEFKRMVLDGADCDVLPGASGEFGRSPDNPIPVNGVVGTLKYLAKLVTAEGNHLLFHRICTTGSAAARYPVDVYEIVCTRDKVWDLLFIDMYHPRRSNKAPSGYRLEPYDKKFGDRPLCCGVNVQVAGFPQNLPEPVGRMMGSKAFEDVTRKLISALPFQRPPDHVRKLMEKHFIPTGFSRVDPGETEDQFLPTILRAKTPNNKN